MKKEIVRGTIMKFDSMTAPLSLQDAIKESHRCLLCLDAPCSSGCPAGTDPGKFIRQIRFENYKGSARTIRNNNVLGTVCAYVCPVEELCEKECSAKALEDPINISGLQRFAVEYGRTNGLEPLERGVDKKKNVAVIGAGPAGIACACELAKMGYTVEIFEKTDRPGGVLWYGIPDFRLPGTVLKSDFENLKDLGVKVTYKSHFNSDGDISKLLNNGFDTVFLSVGLTKGKGETLYQKFDNAMTSNEFLLKSNTKREEVRLEGKSVVVIGGGSVAMDASSTAVALGAKRTYILYRRTIKEMPASEIEIKVAQTMNVAFRTLSIVKDVEARGKTIIGLKGIEVEWVEDRKSDKKNAVEIPGTEFGLKVDLVVEAIGSSPGEDVDLLGSGIERNQHGYLTVGKGGATNLPCVFAGGDIINGGKTVVQAVGEGKKAALAIDKFLTK